jgi:inositol hexakisphosphate/diphosphoinositol-pentakisphosphate kinase
MLWKSIKNFLKKPNKRKIRLGICAMDKKAKSKPMSEILDRLPKEMFEVELFGDDRILNQPIDTWPVVDVLITFYSTKFPTEKALDYIKLRKPFLINDLEMDNTTLKDRRKVYNLLKSIGIDVPTHVFVNRDEGEDNNVIEEYDEVSVYSI